MSQSRHSLTCRINGTVQGVGFRPTIVRLAQQAALGGWVQNGSDGVYLKLTGPSPEALQSFLDELPGKLPPLATITTITTLEAGETDASPTTPFSIRQSRTNSTAVASIPADIATCDACRCDLFTPGNRRYGYPFTTCTNCGPRYTVVSHMPYDRANTSLAPFPLCTHCEGEYTNPADRRFHAESLACPACGPALTLLQPDLTPCSGDPLTETRTALFEGKIVAVMGLGGFLLAVDAKRADAIATLRKRKKRPHKPFAVMMPDLATVQRHAIVPHHAAKALTSPEAPIVILQPLPDTPLPVDAIAPDTRTIGLMLPTTPLHHLLLSPLRGDPTPPFNALIMTSGNRHGDPICLTPEEALQRLTGIADFFLIHDREIKLRCDDSLVSLQGDMPQIWRRARGYAPASIPLPSPLARTTLAMGADLKNTIALGWHQTACLSPHIGDLNNAAASDALERVARQLPEFLDHEPEHVVVDLHPDLFATRIGEKLARVLGTPVTRIQHHHAHAAACLAEHGHTSGLALAFDGTGLGPDGTIWGAELLEVADGSFRRLATFQPALLPGGDQAIRDTRRQLVARLQHCTTAKRQQLYARLGITEPQRQVWDAQCSQDLHAPRSHAAGRLFDAVATLLGIVPDTITYEGQAAIRLEAAATRTATTPHTLSYNRTISDDGVLCIDWAPTFEALLDAPYPHQNVAPWALAFHYAVAAAAVDMVDYATAHSPYRHIALTGGVFMNHLLTAQLTQRLREMELTPLIHHALPPNDGNIAYGQLAAARLGDRSHG